MKLKTLFNLVAKTALIAIPATHCFAAETVFVESRKPDGTPNAPAWSEISGKWNTSKNKTRIAGSSLLVATNVSICVTNFPAPAFKVSPEGLAAGATYKVEVTFSTTSTHGAAPDLIVGVSASGVAANTIPTNTPAFQRSGADQWNVLGTVTPSTNRPTLTFSYVSGNLSPVSRWYADAIRFTPETTPTKRAD